jgi:hypothetical protein
MPKKIQLTKDNPTKISASKKLYRHFMEHGTPMPELTLTPLHHFIADLNSL